LSGQGKPTITGTKDDLLNHRQRILSEAIELYQQDLLTGIRVYLWRFKVVINRDSIEERSKVILQETVVQALQHAMNYEPSRPARAWLLGVAINEIRHLRRKLGLERGIFTPVSDTAEARVGPRTAGHSGLSEAEMFDLLYNSNKVAASRYTLQEILSVVDETDRKILELHFVEGLSGRELAAALGIGEGYAYTRLSRAKAHLREAFLENSK
jgi:RNA polymerase sigma factor (sigma-70 family)